AEGPHRRHRRRLRPGRAARADPPSDPGGRRLTAFRRSHAQASLTLAARDATSRHMRHLVTLFLAATALAAAAPACAQDLAARAAAVRDQALADPTAWRVVESLTTDIGARPVGSPAMARARDWGVATLTALGFENVHVEPFTTRAWARGEESAEVVSP